MKNLLIKIPRLILPGNLPDFIIIGAQKSGTSSLHYYLSKHPDLSASIPKETHYFDRYVNHNYSLDWYKSHFYTRPFRQLLYFESTPNYIYSERVAEQLASLVPQIKLILILREPVSRSYSAWNMYKSFFEKNEIYKIQKEQYPGEESTIYKYLYKNRNSFPSFIDAIKIEEELIKIGKDKEPAIIRRGFYAEQIKHYLKYFDRDQILILGFKELFKNVSGCLEKVYDFLEIKSIDTSHIEKERKNSRSYDRNISRREREYVQEIFIDHNNSLFALLGFKPQW